MTKTFHALGVAASLLMGTAVAASAAATADSQGNTAPTNSSVQQGTRAPGYQTTQTSPSNGQQSTATPRTDSGTVTGAGGAGGVGAGGSAGGGTSR